MGEKRRGGGRSGATLAATAAALASLACLTLAAVPAAADAALLYYKSGVDLGIGGGSSISCPSPTQCTAVYRTQEATFNPAAPNPVRRATIDPGGGLDAVDCPSSTQCTAVDNNGGEVTFDPTAPANRSSATIDPGSQPYVTLNAVACPSSIQCTAIDDRNVVTFNPAAPGTPSVTLIDPNSTYRMNALACPSPGQCTIVSGEGREYTIDPVAKTGATALIDDRPLWAIACPSISQCTAIDSVRAITITPGAVGTPFPIDPNPSNPDESLTAIACPSTSQCTAVDDQGFAVQGNPTDPHGWGAFDLSAGNGGLHLVDVACPSTDQCVALDSGGNAWNGAPKAPPPPPPSPKQVAAQIRAALLRAPLDPTRGRPPLTISDILYVPQSFAAVIPFDPNSTFTPAVSGRLVIGWYLVPRGAHIARGRRRATLIASSGVITYPTSSGGEIQMTPAGWRLMKHSRRVTLTAKATFKARGIPPVTVTRRFTLGCAALTPSCNENYWDFCSNGGPPQSCGGNIPRGAGDRRRRLTRGSISAGTRPLGR